MKSVLWWEGPPFLCLPENELPCDVVSTMDDVICKEMMKNPPSTTHVFAIQGRCTVQLDAVFNVAQFSNLNFLLRVTARVFCFMKNLKDRTAGKEQIVANHE